MANDKVIKNELLLAVKKHCLDCMGGDKESIDNCKASRESSQSFCLLYDYRAGPLTQTKVSLKQLKLTIKQNCQRCIGPGEKVENCTCNGSDGFNKCKLYDHRMIL
jgi:hypothetical protein